MLCSACQQELKKEHYSSPELKKKEHRRCRACIEAGESAAQEQPPRESSTVSVVDLTDDTPPSQAESQEMEPEGTELIETEPMEAEGDESLVTDDGNRTQPDAGFVTVEEQAELKRVGSMERRQAGLQRQLSRLSSEGRRALVVASPQRAVRRLTS